MFRIWISARLLKPRMFVGGMIDDEVDQNADATLFCGMRELDEIAEGPVRGIDTVVIGEVLAFVFSGRCLKRHQPNRRDAEPMEIIEAPHQALEIADAIAV